MKFKNIFQRMLCKHDYKLVKKVDQFWSETDKMPMYTENIYMCEECGKIKRIKL